MASVMHVVPPMILQFVPASLLNYTLHIAVDTHKRSASLSISPICFKSYEIQDERSSTKQPVYFSSLEGDLEGTS